MNKKRYKSIEYRNMSLEKLKVIYEILTGKQHYGTKDEVLNDIYNIINNLK